MYKIRYKYGYDVHKNDGIHTDIRIPVHIFNTDAYPRAKYPVDSWEVWITQALMQRHAKEVTITLNNGGFIVPHEFTGREIAELKHYVFMENIPDIVWLGANV